MKRALTALMTALMLGFAVLVIASGSSPNAKKVAVASSAFSQFFDGPEPEGLEEIHASDVSRGQYIFRLPGGWAETADALSAHLTAKGMSVNAMPGTSDTLILAAGPGGAAFVFVQADPSNPDYARVVVNLQEE